MHSHNRASAANAAMSLNATALFNTASSSNAPAPFNTAASSNAPALFNTAASSNAPAPFNTAAPSTKRLSAYCVAHRAKVNMLRAKLMNFSDNSKPVGE